MLTREELAARFPSLDDGGAIVASAFARYLKPPPDRSVADWAEDKRYVAAESGSPFPGKWSNQLAPYLIEPMECLATSHPSTDVTLCFSAQTGKTAVGENFFGYTVDEDPAPMLLVLPSLDESKKFVRMKLQPAIDATPTLRHKVADQKSRDENGSTAAFKRFRGGFAQITGANSSKGLQMISVRRLWGDEISEWPWDVDGRGDPIELAMARTTSWSNRGVKRLWSSTPGIEGECRITAYYAQSDCRRFYLPCPHCGDYQVLAFENMKAESETAPYKPYFVCISHGCIIEHHDKRPMVARGVWIKTFKPDPDTEDVDAAPPAVIQPELIAHWRGRLSRGRQPGFHIWQAYSPFVNWDATIEKHLKAKSNPRRMKVFSQQVLGKAYEAVGDAPDHEKLLKARSPFILQTVPFGGLRITGAADIQVNRIEWAVYAWGIGLTYWLIDFGIIEGEPDGDGVWQALDAIRGRTYTDSWGRAWPIEAFGVDSGYKSQRVYNYARGRPNVLATDGRDGWTTPLLGIPKRVDVYNSGKPVKGGAMLWPVGTWTAKSELYGSLRKTIDGPDQNGLWPLGTGHFPEACDEAFFKQLTAESLVLVDKRDGSSKREWRKPRDQPNEQLDLWVISRAMAYHLGLDHYDLNKWKRLAAERMTEPDALQMDLGRIWTPQAADDPTRKALRERYLQTLERQAKNLNG